MQRILPSAIHPRYGGGHSSRRGDIMLEKSMRGGENGERMKLDLFLERQGALVLIAWARETTLGVYMGVRFSPEVENASYFKDGQRELLRFPMMPNGKRKREEVSLDRRSPIPAIEKSELILGRLVNLGGGAQSSPPSPKASAGTSLITISEEYLGDYPCLYYEAHLIRIGYTEEFLAEKKGNWAAASDDQNPSIRHFPLDSFPEHNLTLILQRTRSFSSPNRT
jgi:hypothetical protein